MCPCAYEGFYIFALHMSTSVRKGLRKTKSSWQTSSSLEEKLSERGAFSLSNAELLGILLKALACKESPLEQAKALLLKAGNSLLQLAKVPVGRLVEWPGMNTSRAYALTTVLEFARRLQIEDIPNERVVISTTHIVRQLMQPYLKGLLHEEFWLILLDAQQQLLGKRQISIGGSQATVADPKIIFRHALSEPSCRSLILVHNHPSGDPMPSEEDKLFTEQLLIVAKVLQINIKDHVIYTDDKGYSFADEGMFGLGEERRLQL